MTSWYAQKSAEVIVIWKRVATLIKRVKAEVSRKDEGLNVRKAVEIRTLMETAATTETLQRTTSCEDRPEAESKTRGGVEPNYAANKD